MGFRLATFDTPIIETSLPALYRCIEYGNKNEVALFLSDECAFAVSTDGDSSWTIGRLAGDCISCYRTDVWERLPIGSSFTFTQE